MTTTVTATVDIIAAARNLATVAHGNTRRTSGELYINHPCRVARALTSTGCTDEAAP